MTILIGTNVILDYVLKREPHAKAAKDCLDTLVSQKAKIWLHSNALMEIYYVTMQTINDTYAARIIISKLLNAFQIISADKADCLRALELDMPDFEYAIMATCAKRLKAAYIITRNCDDFYNSPVMAITPEDWVNTNGR